MKILRTVSIILIVVLLLVAGIWYYLSSTKSPVDKLPAAAADVLEQYMDAYKIGTPDAVQYMHFENDTEVNAYINSGAVLLDYRVLKVEEVNPCLYALKLQMSSSQTLLFGDTWETVYSFLGLIDGKWYYIGNVGHIPEDLRSNLDPSKYQYDDPNVLNTDEIQIVSG